MANILIVDDDMQLAGQVARTLQSAGHTCVTEARAERALEVVDKGEVELIVLDVMLPGISGFELCRRIRSHSKHFYLPILLLSAMNEEEEVAHGLAQGADDYLTKPFRPPELLHHVQRLVEGSASEGPVDELTSLRGAKTMKYEIQRTINRREGFALLYVELVGIRQFGRMMPADARAKAIRHLARALHLCGKELQSKLFKAGHMGGGHFVCIVPREQIEPYCDRVRTVWDEHIDQLYAGLPGKERADNGTVDKPPLLDLRLCVTYHDANTSGSAQSLFDTLTRMRQNALASRGSGVYYDRRS